MKTKMKYFLIPAMIIILLMLAVAPGYAQLVDAGADPLRQFGGVGRHDAVRLSREDR